MKKILKVFGVRPNRIIFALILIGIIFFNVNAWATTYYMPDDFPNLHTAFSGMKGGDTLIIRDGSYTGIENTIDTNHFPPHGTDDNWTVIKAEHNGKVYFGDPNSRDNIFYVEFHNNAYVKFDGLVWLGPTVHIGAVSYLKFLRCGAGNNLINNPGPLFANNVSHHILYEDCYSWGSGRYCNLSYKSNSIIVRRFVGRIDAVNTEHNGKLEPLGGVAFYNSSDCAAQNIIIIDSDTSNYWNVESIVGALTCPNGGGKNILFQGSIVLKGDMPANGQSTGYSQVYRKNIIMWDIPAGVSTGGSSNYSHITSGNIHSNSYYGTIDGHTDWSDSVDNSLFVNCFVQEGVLKHIGSSHSNYFWNNQLNYNNTSSGANDITNVNPLINSLKYLPRIEVNSDLSGKASDGSDVGATVMKKIGVSGTLWGEPGYNTTTNEDLWPWPNEEIIQANMRTYSHPHISGYRGFCADGNGLYGGPITLTSYIWEYLGNPCPAEICGGSSTPSNNPPEADAGSDQTIIDQDGNGNEQITLDGSASSDSDGSITSYVWKENGTQIATGINPSVSLNVGAHTITLVVQDNDGATGSDSVVVTVNSPSDITPPAISSVQSTGVTATSATITWITDEPSSSKAEYGLSSAYGQQVVDSSLVASHTLSLSGLEPATTYHFKVSSTDSNSNTAESSDFTFTTSAQGTVEMHTLQDFEDGALWTPGGGQDPTGNGRGWAFLDAGPNAKIEIDNIGADGSDKSLKITFDSDNPQIYFRSDDKTRDHMPEAAGANRMSFYVRFPEGFPIQSQPYRYDTWQLGTYIHDPSDWNDLHGSTSEDDHGIHHYYHRLTVEQVGDGWVKYIITTQPDQASYSGSTVPPDRGSEYFDNFGRFYFHFGPEAGGPDPGRPFIIWIDEIKFYYDDGTVGGQIHVGGQNDAGFDGEFIPDSNSGATSLPPPSTVTAMAANSIDLSWSSVSGAVGYNVYRSTTSGSGYAKINGSTPVTGTSYVDQNTTPGTTYYYVVTSVNSAGQESVYSSEASATEPIGNGAPSIGSFTAAPNPADNPKRNISFSVQASDPDGDALSYTIDFGDGSAAASTSTAEHAYSSDGKYTAKATVADGNGHTVEKTIQVTVNDSDPAKVSGVHAQ